MEDNTFMNEEITPGNATEGMKKIQEETERLLRLLRENSSGGGSSSGESSPGDNSAADLARLMLKKIQETAQKKAK